MLIVAPDLETEILLRSGRAHGSRLSYPWEDSFVPRRPCRHVRGRGRRLQPGDRCSSMQPGRATSRRLRAHPSRDPLTDPTPTLAPLQEWALKRIERRFRLRAGHHRRSAASRWGTLRPRG